MQSLDQFYPVLNTPAKAVVTMHQKPDGDAMGSALGLYHFLVGLGHDATVISPTNWADFLNWMPGGKKVMDFDYQRYKAKTPIEAAELIFCLDFNIWHRTKPMAQPLSLANCIKI